MIENSHKSMSRGKYLVANYSTNLSSILFNRFLHNIVRPSVWVYHTSLSPLMHEKLKLKLKTNITKIQLMKNPQIALPANVKL